MFKLTMLLVLENQYAGDSLKLAVHFKISLTYARKMFTTLQTCKQKIDGYSLFHVLHNSKTVI